MFIRGNRFYQIFKFDMGNIEIFLLKLNNDKFITFTEDTQNYVDWCKSNAK